MNTKHLVVCISSLAIATAIAAADPAAQASDQARQQAEEQALKKAEQERQKTEQERQKAEQERQKAEEQARKKEEQERQKAEQQRQADEQARQQAEQEARIKEQQAAEAQRQQAEAERQKAEQQRQADEQARQKAEEQVRQQAEQERQKAEQQRQADEQARQQAEADRQKAEAAQQAGNQKPKSPAEIPAPTDTKESTEQSAARPYDLDIAAPVQLAGSDAASSSFQTNDLPGLQKLVDSKLSESTVVNDMDAVALDPSKLTLAYDANIRVYFLGEGAGYKNTLGFSTTGGSPLSPDAKLIFPDASSSGSTRTSNDPLLAGDFVDLGTFSAGTALDFFLIADGANGGKQFFSTQQSLNSDGLVHAVSLAQDGSAYLIYGFEDLFGGGDRDYNDLVFAVEIGRANINNLAGLGAPEPSMAAGALFSLCGLGFIRRRKNA